jgi:midasin (ATPase involved in ribosome maturation)
MKREDWVVFENANLCPANGLDRLIPLLEPNGKLLVNERGLTDNGEYVTIKPHSNFR